MFKKMSALCFLASVTSSVLAYEAECPDNAIDAMEDEDRYSHCEYKDTGLNGRLQRFFSAESGDKKSSEKVISVYEEADDGQAAVIEQAVVPLVEKTHVSSSVAVESPRPGKPVVRAIYNIRESFDVASGPHGAINGLYGQMLKYCAGGWSKNSEWVERKDDTYYLHYQFRCLN